MHDTLDSLLTMDFSTSLEALAEQHESVLATLQSLIDVFSEVESFEGEFPGEVATY